MEIQVFGTAPDTSEAIPGFPVGQMVNVGVTAATAGATVLPVTFTITSGNALFDTTGDGQGDAVSHAINSVGEVVRVVAASPTSTGNVTISATDSTPVTDTVTIFFGLPQILLFDPIPNTAFSPAPNPEDRTRVPLNATVTQDATNSTITFTLQTAPPAGVATLVNASGNPDPTGRYVRLDGVGLVSVTATSSRTATRLSVEAFQSFNATAAVQDIEFIVPEDISFGDFPFIIRARAIDAYGNPTGAPVSLSLIAGSATLEPLAPDLGYDRALITALGAGAISVQAIGASGEDFQSVTRMFTFPVAAAETSTGALILDQWVWRNPQPSPADGRFNDIVYDSLSGLFVAVGDSDGATASISTSADGVNWTAQNGVVNENLLSIAFDGITFVAVGSGGTVLTSADGIAWAVQVSGVPDNLNGVFYDATAGFFVAVGEDGTIIRSNNGAAWADATTVPASIGNLNAVAARANGRLIAVGDSSIIVSDDGGDTWQLRMTGLSQAMRAVMVDQFTQTAIAVGDGSRILTSPQGDVWNTQFSGGDFSLTGVAQGNGYFVAVGAEGRLVTSPDMVHWTQRTTRFESGFQGLGFGNGAFIGVGDGFSILSSPTGESWTLRDSLFSNTYESVAYGNVNDGTYVAVGSNASIMVSTDGESWTLVAPPAGFSEDLAGVSYGASVFTAVGANGSIIRSTNGVVWTEATDSGLVPGSQLRDVTFSNNTFVAVGTNFTVMTSTDGDNWTMRSTGSGNDFYGVASRNGRFVAVGANGNVYVSNDGANWQFRFSGTGVNLQGVAASLDGFIAVGDAGTILFSTNGDAWSPVNSGVEVDLHGIVASNGGVFAVVGQNFTILTSRNGVDWSAQSPGSLNNLYGVGFGDGRFVAVGQFESILTSEDIISSGLDNWNYANPVVDGNTANDVIYAGGRYVAVGDHGMLLISTDGENWQTKDIGITNDLRAVAYGSNTYIVVGENVILRSVNGGDTWAVNTNWMEEFNAIEYAGGRFVAVGDTGTGIVSNNLGLNWTLLNLSIPADLVENLPDIYGVTFGGGWWVAVGSSYPNVGTGNIPIDAYDMHYIGVSKDGINWETRIAQLVSLEPIQYRQETLRDVKYGNGVFLAVGDGVVLRSTPAQLDLPDPIVFEELDDDGVVTKRVYGTRWPALLASTSMWTAITYGEPDTFPTFVLVNRAGGAFYTENGSSFGVSFPGMSKAFTGVAYGNNQFIGSAEDGRILFSPDGNRWSIRTTANLGALLASNSNAPERVSVGQNGVIFMSTEPGEWHVAETSGLYPVDYNGVAYGNGRHVVVGSGGWIMSSTDASHWTPRVSNVSENLRAVSYGSVEDNGNTIQRFVAVGANGAVTYSGNGQTWQSATALSVNLNGIANGDNRFVAVGDNRSIRLSTNGTAWTTPDTGSIPAALQGSLYSITYGSGQFIAVGQSGQIIRSNDAGDNWSVVPSGVSVDLLGITYGEGVFVAVGSNGTIISSSDGINWRKRPSGSDNNLFAVGFSGGVFSSVGAFGTILESEFANRLPQILTFNPLPNQSLGTGPIPLTAVSTSGLPVTYFVLAGPATINPDNGTQLLLSDAAVVPTTVTVRATQPGDDEYAPATPVDRSFTIINRLQEIEFEPIADIVFRDTTTVALDAESFDVLTTNPTELPIVFEVISGSATLSSAGNSLNITGAGSVTVRASQPGNSTYAAADVVTQVFNVGKAKQQIYFPEINERGLNQFPFQPTASSVYVNEADENTELPTGLTVAFEVLDGPATVSGNQIFLDNAIVGDVIEIRAFQLGNNNYLAAAPVTRTVTIVPLTQTVSWATGNVGSVSLSAETINVEAVSTEAGATITYSVVSGGSRASFASPSSPVLTLQGIGQVTIRATAASVGTPPNQVPSSFVEQTISITGQGQTITFPAIADKFVTDPPFQLLATASSGLPITYTVLGGTNVVTINGSVATLTGVPGAVTIRASQEGDSTYGPAVAIERSFAVLDAQIGDIWYPQTSPVSTNLLGISSAAELFLIAGSASTILSSENSLSWASRAGGTGALRSIAMGGVPNVYIAVGSQGQPLISTDGLEWDVISSPLNGSINKVIYAAGRFVAVGNNGLIATSLDGESWSTRQSGVSANLRDIIFSGNRFIAVGANVILRSNEQASSWSATSFPEDYQLNALARGSGQNLVVVGDEFLVLTSSNNGTSWQARPPAASNDLRGIAYGADRYTAVGSEGGIFTSPNGITWTSRDSTTANDLNAVLYADNLFIVVGNAGTILTSGAVAQKSSQTIDFAPIPQPDDGVLTTTLTATAQQAGGSPSMLPVAFYVVQGGASVSGTSMDGSGVTTATLTLTGVPGTVLVRAVQPGGALYYPAPSVDQDLAVEGQQQVLTNITPPAGTLGYTNAPITLNAESRNADTDQPTGLTVNFELVSGSATLSGTELRLNENSVGTDVVVRAFNEGNSSYLPVSQNITYSIVRDTADIIIEAIPDKLLNAQPFFVSARTSNGEDVGLRIIEGSSLISLRTYDELDEAGNRTVRHQVTLRGTNDAQGWVTLQAYTTANNSVTAESATESFYISRFRQSISFAEITPKTFGDADFDISASADGGGVVVLSLADDLVGELNGTTITILGAGTITVLATAEPSGDYGPAEAELTIPVGKANQRLQFERISDQFAIAGLSIRLLAQTFIADNEQPASPVEYPIVFSLVRGSNVATLDRTTNTLTLTGLDGIVTVQAAQAGNSNVNAATAIQRTFSVSQFGKVPFQGDGTIRGSAYGNGRHIAVGDEGFIFRSGTNPDEPLNWSFVAGPTTEGLYDIAFGLGKFVAVGWFGTVLTSESGAQWTKTQVDQPLILNAITFGNGRFVTVASGGIGYVSTDGLSWSRTSLPGFNPLVDVAYGESPAGEPRFVAVGPVGTILTSPDGVSWTVRNAGTQLNLNGVGYGDGLFVIVGDRNLYLFSVDGGVTWERRAIPEETLEEEVALASIAFGASSFRVVGPKGLIMTASPAAIVQPRNPDTGLSRWVKEVSVGEQALLDVSFGGDRFVTVGEDVTILVSLPDTALSSAISMGDGFYWSDWMAHFFGAHMPWIYHFDLGWLYLTGTEGSLWMFSPDLGWLWTNRDVYPWLYRNDIGGWCFYAEDTGNPRAIYNSVNGEWEFY